jgi:hypothetical protein
MSKILMVLKSIAYLAIALVAGFIMGDEFQERKLRAELRALCYEESLSRVGGDADELTSMIIKFQCRNTVP